MQYYATHAWRRSHRCRRGLSSPGRRKPQYFSAEPCLRQHRRRVLLAVAPFHDDFADADDAGSGRDAASTEQGYGGVVADREKRLTRIDSSGRCRCHLEKQRGIPDNQEHRRTEDHLDCARRSEGCGRSATCVGQAGGCSLNQPGGTFTWTQTGLARADERRCPQLLAGRGPTEYTSPSWPELLFNDGVPRRA